MNKVSVCVASYNGELYIREQLDSILSQIGTNDEVIVVDDCSTDTTFDILKEYQRSDFRVKIFRNKKNIGHVKNFEKALSISTGDILMLADQDDIWSKDKYSEVIQILQQNHSVGMIYHALKRIDSCGRVIDQCAKFSNRQIRIDRLKFVVSQFFSFQVFGCSMTLRRQNISVALPFPRFVTYAHDHWLTILSVFDSEVIFYDSPLVYYRQHNSNLTPRFGLSLIKKIKVRLYLFILSLAAIVRVFNNNRLKR